MDTVAGPYARHLVSPVTQLLLILHVRYDKIDLFTHYSELYTSLSAASSESACQMHPLNSRLQFPALISRVLAQKHNLRARCIEAYKTDTEALLEVVETCLDPLIASSDLLWKFYRDKIWLATFKPHGLEVVEMRFAALRSRLGSMRERILAYARHESTGGIAEFEGELSCIHPGAGMDLTLDFASSYTPSRALGAG